MDSPFSLSRRSLVLGALAAPVVSSLGVASAAAVAFHGQVVQEPGEYEARFPDLLRLNDGRIMAVWHKATEHAGTVGVIRIAFSTSADGTSWSTPHNALAAAGATAGIDTRDPKLGLMKDGSVIMTFFTSTGAVYYSVWKPGWNYFTEPKRLLSFTAFCHGAPLALDTYAGRANEVLVPYYTSGTTGGAWYVRTRWVPETNTLEIIESPQRIITNDNPAGRVYQEPSFVQIGTTIVCVVRSQNGTDPSPATVVRWDAYSSAPTKSYQYFAGVLASSHHLLKTPDGKVLFTYGDRSRVERPTVGMLISNPTSTWVAGRVVSIYNSGAYDQANPSSVMLSDGSFLTTGYNAKPKSSSASGGTLWLLRSLRSEY